MVLLAAFTGLRLGELRALRRSKLYIARTKVHVVEETQELKDGTLLVGEPKSDAGRRIVTLPQAIVGDMEAHLASWAAPGPDGLIFKDAVLSRWADVAADIEAEEAATHPTPGA